MNMLSKNVAEQEAYMNHIINKRFFCNFLQREGVLELWKKSNKHNLKFKSEYLEEQRLNMEQTIF